MQFIKLDSRKCAHPNAPEKAEPFFANIDHIVYIASNLGNGTVIAMSTGAELIVNQTPAEIFALLPPGWL